MDLLFEFQQYNDVLAVSVIYDPRAVAEKNYKKL